MSAISIPLAIGIGGCVGALTRYYLSELVVWITSEDYWFYGTLTVNLIGCLAIGGLTAVVTHSDSLSPATQKFLITGIVGSLTTFSTFALDTLKLLQSGRTGEALLNLVCNLVAGVFLVWIGMSIASALLVEDGV